MEVLDRIKKIEKWLHVIMLSLLLAFLWLTYPASVSDEGWLLYWIIAFDFSVFVGCAYFTSYFLLPRYFIKGNYLRFFCYYLVVLFIGTSLILLNDLILLSLYSNPEEKDKGLRLVLFYASTLGMTFMITSVGVSIRALIYWIKSQHQLNMVQKEHLKSELAFLRSQMNPHFLFNTINLVFGHIDKSNKSAREIIVLFSDLLRYQLYECDAALIPVEKEISYLVRYVDLQKLRKNDSVSCNVKLSGVLEGFDIPPLLVMPLVENAFKYVSFDERQRNYLDIELYGDNEQFSFSCVNSKSSLKVKELVNGKGLGLQNLSRRLEILFPGKHELQIADLENSFEVQLTIKR
jgi:two-component system, LytTR family, sensor kinase